MRAMLLVLVLGTSCARAVPTGGLVVQGDAAAVGAVVRVNGRVVGRLKEEWWVTTSPVDSVFVGGPRVHALAGGALRRDSSLASRLDARCPVGDESEFVVVGPRGQRLQATADLGESTEVWVSFADRTIRVQPIDEAGQGGRPAGEADDGDGYRAEAPGAVPAPTPALPHERARRGVTRR